MGFSCNVDIIAWLYILYLPSHIMTKDIKLPTAPNKEIVRKFWKNCFFFTWNLVMDNSETKKISTRSHMSITQYTHQNTK